MMRKKRFMRIIATFIMALIISMPFYPSYVFAQNVNQYENLEGPPYDVAVIEDTITEDLDNSVYECINKNEETNALVEMFDNDIINTLTNVISLIKAICSIMNGIEVILSALTSVLGAVPQCCVLSGTPFVGVCELLYLVYEFWHGIYFVFEPICCIATCGTCTGVGKCGGVSMSIKGMTFNPEDSIFVSMACLCLPGILMHMKRLKLIYQVYNCCIEEACTYGLSTETCEQELDFQTCMFWEGGVISALIGFIANIIISILANWLASDLVMLITPCANSWFELVAVPTTWISLMSTIDNMDKTFDDPKCEDLGFSDIEDYIPEDIPIWIMIKDTDGDGKYDQSIILDSPPSGSVTGRVTGAVTSAVNKITGKALQSLFEDSEDDSDIGNELNSETDANDDANDDADDDTDDDTDDADDADNNADNEAYRIDNNAEKDTDQNKAQKTESKPTKTLILSMVGDKIEFKYGWSSYGEDITAAKAKIKGTWSESGKRWDNYKKTWSKKEKETPKTIKPMTKEQKLQKAHTGTKKALSMAYSMFLEPIADKKIIEHCSKSRESSMPENEVPVDQTIGSPSLLASTSPCDGELNGLSISAQASYSQGVYTYSYYGLSCNQDLYFQIRLQNPQFLIVESLNIPQREIVSNSGSINETHMFTEICIHTNNQSLGTHGIWCSPISGV